MPAEVSSQRDPVIAPPVTPVPAATVVLLRPGPRGLEVLLTHRPSSMAFAAGMHVFPGGRVDAADAGEELATRSALDAATAAARLGDELPGQSALAMHVAAIRELWEEVGILLADTPRDVASVAAARVALLAGRTDFASVAADLGLRLRTDLLVPLSRWVTPPAYPRRFDARFFAAVAPSGEASIAGEEVAAIDWHVPSEALDAMADGRIGMWLPTSCTLQQLEHLRDVTDLDRLRPGPLDPVAIDEPAGDVVRVRMPAAGGVAGQPVNAYLVGRRRFVLVDPGDPTGPALERCLEEAARRGGTIAAIALTHADPDHHGGAEALAEQLSIPILAGRGAARRFPNEVREVADRAVIDAGDVPLTVLETPGPRPEHLAFLVRDHAVVIGDLDGRRGSRSIVGPADAAAWSRSSARVDALPATVVRLPGHP